MAVPTMEWQDRISAQLASSSPLPSGSRNRLPSSSPTFNLTSGAPLMQRRRTDPMFMFDAPQFQPEWNDMYTMGDQSGRPEQSHCNILDANNIPSDSDGNAGSDVAEGVGQLSLDENSEVCSLYSRSSSRSKLTLHRFGSMESIVGFTCSIRVLGRMIATRGAFGTYLTIFLPFVAIC